MRPTDLITSIKALYAYGCESGSYTSVCVEGSPGVGKTQTFQQIAKELGIGFEQRHLPTIPVEDLGVPMVDREQLYYKMPDWFPTEGSSHDDGRGGILLLDDRNQADKDMQKCVANLIQERELHGRKLLDQWMIVSTGNRTEDRAGSNRVLSHLRNREYVVTYEAHLDDWTDWAMKHGISPVLVAFMKFRPELFNKFEADQDVNPTPRAWTERVNPLLSMPEGTLPKQAEVELLEGAVGKGAAHEFLGYLRVYRDLPDIDAVLRDPENAVVPKDDIVKYAMSGAIAAKMKPANMKSVMTYLDRFPAEFNVLALRSGSKYNPDIVETEAFSDWASANIDVLV